MANITLSIDNDLVKAGREYSKKNLNCSLNDLVRDLLRKTVTSSPSDWTDEFFALADKTKGDSKGKKWNRSELYER